MLRSADLVCIFWLLLVWVLTHFLLLPRPLRGGRLLASSVGIQGASGLGLAGGQVLGCQVGGCAECPVPPSFPAQLPCEFGFSLWLGLAQTQGHLLRAGETWGPGLGGPRPLALLLMCHQENRFPRREHFPKGPLLLLACEGLRAQKPGDLLSWPQFLPLHMGREELWELRATDGVGHLLRKSPRESHAPASPESVHASTFLGRFCCVHHSLKDAGSRKPLNTPHTCSSSSIPPNTSGKGSEIAARLHHHGLEVMATLDGRWGDLSQCLAAGRPVPGTGLKEGGHWVEQWTAPACAPLLRAEGARVCQSAQQLLRWAWLSQSRS